MKDKNKVKLLTLSSVSLAALLGISVKQTQDVWSIVEAKDAEIAAMKLEQLEYEDIELNYELTTETESVVSIASVSYDRFEKFWDDHSLSSLLYTNAKTFYSKSLEYSVDPALALATFIQEVGWNGSELWFNAKNAGGIKCFTDACTADGYQIYSNEVEGIESMIKHIHIYQTEYGLKTVDEIRNLWSESDDTENVLRLIKIIRGEY